MATRAGSSAIASGSIVAALTLSACGGGVIVAPTSASTSAVVSASIGVTAAPDLVVVEASGAVHSVTVSRTLP